MIMNIISTKANPNPICRDYNKKHPSFLVKEQHKEFCEDKYQSLATGCRVWGTNTYKNWQRTEN